ncbi:MAG: single-stranded DNA-binding protein [Bacteroidales bacterium]|nr:single-stranded DNA-binding protein [Bacteroidales bacterium]
MAGLNKVILIGRLGKDPEVISFDNGAKKMTVSLATSERYRDRDGSWKDLTEWHNVVAWGNLAVDIAEKRRNYIKGDLLYIEGKIKTRQYTDGQGVTKYITEIVAERMNLILKGGHSSYENTHDQTASTEMDEGVGGKSSHSDSAGSHPTTSEKPQNDMVNYKDEPSTDDLPF